MGPNVLGTLSAITKFSNSLTERRMHTATVALLLPPQGLGWTGRAPHFPQMRPASSCRRVNCFVCVFVLSRPLSLFLPAIGG